MRLPDRLFRILRRVYLAQERLRREEARRALEAEDRRMREHYKALHARHVAGTCGGAAAGCCYVPCVPRVDS